MQHYIVMESADLIVRAGLNGPLLPVGYGMVLAVDAVLLDHAKRAIQALGLLMDGRMVGIGVIILTHVQHLTHAVDALLDNHAQEVLVKLLAPQPAITTQTAMTTMSPQKIIATMVELVLPLVTTPLANQEN
jgi:hypothetical protein